MIHSQRRFSYLPDLMQPGWSVPIRALVGGLGLGGLLLAARTRGAPRKALAFLGAASLVRAAFNRTVTELIASVANPAIRLTAGLTIAARVDDVYDFLRDFDNYPRFMSFVREVSIDDRGRMHWRVQGPAGLVAQWETALGELLQNQAISWKSLGGSFVRNSGSFRLRPLPDGRARLDIELAYATPGGLLGLGLAHLLGFDPSERFEEDLLRLKAQLESRAGAEFDVSEFHRA